MLRVTVELIDANTGLVEELGDVEIANVGPTEENTNNLYGKAPLDRQAGYRYTVCLDGGREWRTVTHKRSEGWLKLVTNCFRSLEERIE